MELDIPQSIALLEAQVEERDGLDSAWVRAATEEACLYGRERGLLADYEDELHPFSPSSIFFGARSSFRNMVSAVEDDVHLLPLGIQALKVTERPTLTPAACRVIAGVRHGLSEMDLKTLSAEVSGFKKPNHKLELPILRSDHDLDFAEFQQQVRRVNASQVQNHRLPLDPTDTEKDEGLEFPQFAKRHGVKLMQSVKAEVVGLSREAMQVLSTSTWEMAKWTYQDQECFMREHLTYQKSNAREPLTPPLSPAFPPKEFFIPEGPACQVPIPSDPSSRLSDDVRQAEDAIFRTEEGRHSLDWTPDLSSSDTLAAPSTPDAKGLPDLRPIKLADFRLESPLLPDKREVAGSDVVEVDIMKLARSMRMDSSDETQGQCDHRDHEFLDDIGAKSTHLTRVIEQQRLQPVDALARIAVPVMDFDIPKPAWEDIGGGANTMLEWEIANHRKHFEPPGWPRDKIAESKMRWAPISSEATKIPGEQIVHDPDVLKSLLEVPFGDEVPSSASYVWKTPGLAILREEEDEDEDDNIEPAFSEPASQQDLATLAGKKRRVLQGLELAREKAETTDSIKNRRAQNKSVAHASSSSNTRQTALLMGDSQPTASSLLENYMALLAPSKMTLGRSNFFKAPPKPALESTCSEVASISQTKAVEVGPVLPRAPHPPFDASVAPPKMVIGLSVPRGIIRCLENLLPNLSFIERDYSAYNSSIWIPGSISRSEVISCLAHEADIILSPLTGLIITTMVKVRQRPLPGASGMSVLRHRIERISARYDKLILLVSEGSKDGSESMAEMAPSDAMAFSELQGYLTTLDATVRAYYVGGGEQTVSKWAASFVCRYADEAERPQYFLLESETYWELFLRRAGLNVYGAQAVVGMLKRQNEGQEGAGQQHGLSAFVNMSFAERIELFETVLGGRVLERVSRAIDESWH